MRSGAFMDGFGEGYIAGMKKLALGVFVVLALAAPSMAQFGSQQVITTAADYANSVFATDLDGDGDQDVLSASVLDDKIAWYENLGGGAFGSQQVITTAADGVYSVFATDLDGDGDQDVLSASYSDDKIAWYENQIVPPTTGQATMYGLGCGTPALVFTPTANPIIGNSVSALIASAPTTFAGVSLGASNTIAFPFVLPFELSGVGMPGCHLLQSDDVFGLPVTPATASTLQFNATIPFSGVLVGQHYYIQAYCVAPGANAAQIVASNGIDWLIGNQ
jgi:hypothetical protein